METLLVGMNHQTATVDVRERVAFTPEQCHDAARQLRDLGILKEAVVLSTCNRSELYGVPNRPGADTLRELEDFIAVFHRFAPQQLAKALYRYRGRDAIRHLYRVTSGLDSMLLGEAEIIGQVRESYRKAVESGTTGPVLNRLFQSALEVGKRVRTETGIGVRPMSVAFAGVKLAGQIFGSLEKHRALILGAGATSEQVVEHLCDRGIQGLRVANRTPGKAKELAERFGAAVVRWENMCTSLTWPDLIVSSVSSREPVLTRKILEAAMAARKHRPLLVIDLGVPRNVDANATGVYNLYLYDIDGLTQIVEQNRRARQDEVPKAEAIIGEQIVKFTRWQAGVAACSVFAELNATPLEEREALVHQHLAAMSHLSENDRDHFMGLVQRFLFSAPEAQGNSQTLSQFLSKIHQS